MEKVFDSKLLTSFLSDSSLKEYSNMEIGNRARYLFTPKTVSERKGRMFIIINLLDAIATIIHYSLNIYMWLIIVRALLSWVNPDPYNPIVNFLYQVTEPVLYQIRRYLPFRGLAIDLSPIVAFMIIIFLDRFLVGTLQDIVVRLQ